MPQWTVAMVLASYALLQSGPLVTKADVLRAMEAGKRASRDAQAEAAADLANQRFAAYLAANPPGAPEGRFPPVAPSALPPLPAPGENRWTPGTFNKLNWGPENLHALPWRARNVTVARDGSVHIVADSYGEAGIKSGSNWNGGSIEYEVTFPAAVPSGTDVASGYMFANSNADELNFPEVLSDGRPRFAIHADGRQAVKVLQIDVRGTRHTFGAAWKAGEFVTYTMDGKEVWTVKAGSLPSGLLRLPSAPMAFVSNIAFLPGLPGWAGEYKPLKRGEQVRLIVHGWRYTQF